MKIEKLLENRYEKLRSIGTTSTEQLRRKTQAGRDRIKAAVQAVKPKTEKIPAKV
jgi:hypothetical protein